MAMLMIMVMFNGDGDVYDQNMSMSMSMMMMMMMMMSCALFGPGGDYCYSFPSAWSCFRPLVLRQRVTLALEMKSAP